MLRATFEGVWFTARPALSLIDYYGDADVDETDECRGCMFRKRHHTICKEVGRVALAAGLPDCESKPHKGRPGFIYKIDKTDVRQLDLVAAVDTNPPVSEID